MTLVSGSQRVSQTASEIVSRETGWPACRIRNSSSANSVNGERRSFALLRPIADTASQDRVRDLVLEAYKEHEAELAATA
jgi:hypothetical protein